MRTNAYQRDDAGDRRPALAHQVRLRARSTGCPSRKPYREIFVYSPRVEGLHLRFGADRPRRPALVRPAGGFPHRSAGAGEGAAGQERHHRAGGRQGRVRAQADAARAPTARRCCAKAPPATRSSSRRCSTSPTISRATCVDAAARRACAATATIPISWSPPTRARRASPTPPTPSPSTAASGSATPSPRAARPATTTRRWASPRAARWEAVKRHFREIDRDIQTPAFTVVGVGDMSRRRVRQRHAAVAADPADRGLRPPRHLHRPRSRSGAQPRRARSGCSACRARAGRTTTRTLISQGRRRLFALAEERRRCSPEARTRAGPRQRAGDAATT